MSDKALRMEGTYGGIQINEQGAHRSAGHNDIGNLLFDQRFHIFSSFQFCVLFALISDYTL